MAASGWRVVLGRRAVMRVRGVADSSACDPSVSLPDSFHQLTRLMQFPEEVAIQLTDFEHRLFSRVSAVDYVRLVTSDLTKQPLTLSAAASNAAKPHPTVADLILRFQQVSFSNRVTDAWNSLRVNSATSNCFKTHVSVALEPETVM